MSSRPTSSENIRLANAMALAGIYKCSLCDYEEKVGGSLESKPVSIFSRVLEVKATFSNTRVKAIAEAEIRHVLKVHLASKTRDDIQ